MKIEKLPNERWARIENSRYAISDYGRIMRLSYGRWYGGTLHQWKTYARKLIKPFRRYNKGRWESCVVLMINGKRKHFYISRLVATYFVPNPDPKHKTQVNHEDENTLNNHYTNLSWTTPKENSNWGTRNKRIQKANGIQLICDNVVYNSLHSFGVINKISPCSVKKWLDGNKPMPQEWANRGLSYVI